MSKERFYAGIKYPSQKEISAFYVGFNSGWNKYNKMKKPNETERDDVIVYELKKAVSSLQQKINNMQKYVLSLKERLSNGKKQQTIDRNYIFKQKQEIKQWKETCEIISNPKTMKSISKSLKEFAEGKGIPLDKLKL